MSHSTTSSNLCRRSLLIRCRLRCPNLYLRRLMNDDHRPTTGRGQSDANAACPSRHYSFYHTPREPILDCAGATKLLRWSADEEVPLAVGPAKAIRLL